MIRQLFVLALICSALPGCGLHTLSFDSLSVPAPASQAAVKGERGEIEQQWIPAPVQRLPDPPLLVNADVRREINNLLKGNAACIRTSLERRDPHYETLARIFDDEGVPRDLLNLAVIESRFRAEATSPTGAAGMWQFTRSTARLYGLRVDRGKDERRDIIRSTLAAARHLRDLYHQFEDWYLVLAAYNAGPGAVTKAMRRATSDNFWDLVRRGRLSNQTKAFVPRFIAATILMRTADLYGVEALGERVHLRLATLESSKSKNSTHAEFPFERAPESVPQG